MYLVGTNNSKFVDENYIKKYLDQNHKVNNVYGLSKGDFFWMMDMTFKSPEEAIKYIRLYEKRGFNVFHSISIPKDLKEDVTIVETEQHILPDIDDTENELVPEVKPVEEKQRKGTGGSRRKK
ncbi:hypothetical protein GC105_11490 [Alkalibaculum sp. M08DMB]|uniref:Uncharacterized protein n=1 Tax=Alkalibaculum sporogenes TaxID=2655001 RepID=A0A6A7KAL3_9FIRM|nr:hypothetical protein [Alkalibaculum sporogenes]MPW26412.1 hypothetical protein [Alkalibaculum sporogenes]